jgi:transposase
MAKQPGDELTDEQWQQLEPLLPVLPRRADGRGRPWRSNREILNGILWILRSGARWKDLPNRFPPYQTCHRRFQTWVRSGVLARVLETLANDLQQRGAIDLSECFIDGTFVVAKKGGAAWVPPSGAKARNSWLWQTLMVFLSPSTQQVLRHMKSPLSKILWRKVSRLHHPRI